MTIISTFPTPEDAHLFRLFLGSQGIEAFLLDEYVIQLFWYYSNTLGGVRVVVNDEDADSAISARDAYMAALREGPYPLQPARAWPVVLVLSLLFSMPMLVFGRKALQRAESGPPT